MTQFADTRDQVNLASRSLERRDKRAAGYEPGFIHSLKLALDHYINYRNPNLRIAVNAGGLNPKALAAEVQKLLLSSGCRKRVAYVLGDNVLPALSELEVQPLTRATGNFENWKQNFPDIVLANAYIGCWGIVRALREGADIVICGRCTDASTVGHPCPQILLFASHNLILRS